MGKERFTKLEKAVLAHPEWQSLPAKILAEIDSRPDDWLMSEESARSVIRKRKQETLDMICEKVVASLSPRELCESVIGVYDGTAEEYMRNPHTKDIIDDLVIFMNMFEYGSLVLDLGCGPGRDTFFMSLFDRGFREGLMGRAKEKNGKTTLEKFMVPGHDLRVVGIDGSEAMIENARINALALNPDNAFFGAEEYPRFMVMDIHDNFAFLLRDRANRPLRFDGIWSCASLFTHTPRGFFRRSLENVSRALVPGGIFYVSYTNGRPSGNYNKLIMSSTGRIKWFSQPDPDEIVSIAAGYGLKPAKESAFDDYIKGADHAKDLFVSHFFRKEE